MHLLFTCTEPLFYRIQGRFCLTDYESALVFMSFALSAELSAEFYRKPIGKLTRL